MEQRREQVHGERDRHDETDDLHRGHGPFLRRSTSQQKPQVAMARNEATRKAGAEVSRALEDPWLAPDVERWLARSGEPDLAALAPAVARDWRREDRCSAFDVQDGTVLIAGESGEITAYDAELSPIARFDTATARAVSAMQSRRLDVYCAAGKDVHHFEQPRLRATPGGTFTGDSAPGTGSEGAMSTPPGPGDPDGDL